MSVILLQQQLKKKIPIQICSNKLYNINANVSQILQFNMQLFPYKRYALCNVTRQPYHTYKTGKTNLHFTCENELFPVWFQLAVEERIFFFVFMIAHSYNMIDAKYLIITFCTEVILILFFLSRFLKHIN